RSRDFVRLILIAKLSSMKKTMTWVRAFRARRLSLKSSSTMLLLVRKRIESPKNPVTVQNSQPYGQPRPDSIGIMWRDPQPDPYFFKNGRTTLGIMSNCSRLKVSHGMVG